MLTGTFVAAPVVVHGRMHRTLHHHKILLQVVLHMEVRLQEDLAHGTVLQPVNLMSVPTDAPVEARHTAVVAEVPAPEAQVMGNGKMGSMSQAL